MNCPICKTNNIPDFQEHIYKCFNRFELSVAEDERGDLDALSAVSEERDAWKSSVLVAEFAMNEYKEYRRMNTLNFQLEKADSYINAIEAALLAKVAK